MSQVLANLESQRWQYQMAEVRVIEEDLGRSGSGQIARPGFSAWLRKCVSGRWAVYCIEASRLQA